jgi:hypothetical protein
MPTRWNDADPKTISLKEKIQIIDTNLKEVFGDGSAHNG